MIPESFHFLRPAWLVALAPLALALWAAAGTQEHANPWRRLVDRHLLRHLVVTGGDGARRWPLLLGALAGAAACLALAGPAWERIPQPTFTGVDPTVVVLDLSPAMNVDDLSPSRLARARHELQDILDRTRGGQVGLVLYSDEPFVAAPLTDDARVVAEMIPSLESGLMPLRPARTDRALAQAQALLDQAGAASGRVVLLSAGSDAASAETLAAARALAASGRTLGVLGAGTDGGAPLRDARGRVVTGGDGRPVMTSLDRAALEALAAAGGGSFSALRADDADLATVLPSRAPGSVRDGQQGSSAQFDVWRDAGIWLVLIPLLVAPLAFRRGLVAAIALALVAGGAGEAAASTWSDLWNRRDQQAQAALDAGDAARAATLFEDRAWQAAATYQNGDYASSAEAYATLEGDQNRYNLGTALARAGQLEEAVAAYDEVLASLPEHDDARFNRDLVQRLLDQQREQQERQQQNQEQNQEQDQSAQQGAGEQPQEQQQAGGTGDQEQQHGDGAGEQPQDAGGAPPGGEPGARPDEQQQAADGAAGADSQGPGEEPEQAQADGPPSGGLQEQTREDAARHAGDRDENHPEADAQQEASAAQAGAAPSPEQNADHDATAAAADRPDEQHQAAAQDRTLAETLDQELADAAPHEQPGDQEPANEDGDTATAAAASSGVRPLTEREQAREQALRNIPSDPGGLLRAKIRRQYAEKRFAQHEEIPSW